jgi:hypothetical protein
VNDASPRTSQDTSILGKLQLADIQIHGNEVNQGLTVSAQTTTALLLRAGPSS